MALPICFCESSSSFALPHLALLLCLSLYVPFFKGDDFSNFSAWKIPKWLITQTLKMGCQCWRILNVFSSLLILSLLKEDAPGPVLYFLPCKAFCVTSRQAFQGPLLPSRWGRENPTELAVYSASLSESVSFIELQSLVLLPVPFSSQDL